MQTKIESTTKTVSQGTEWVRSYVFTPAHNAMDFVENKMESVMLKPSSGMFRNIFFSVRSPQYIIKVQTIMVTSIILFLFSKKSATSNEPGLVNTASRLIDVTYRVNAGVINTVGQKVQDVTDKKNWVRNIIFRILNSRLRNYPNI